MAETQNNPSVVGVLLAGGVGARLWPVSRQAYPKQFSALVGDSDLSMLQQTINRVEGSRVSKFITLCSEKHRFLVEGQLSELNVDSQIILEPEGRNTAPAIALAALQATSIAQDPILVVLPSDHQIADAERFNEALETAVALAEQGNLVTFGVAPLAAETGYGYIKIGTEMVEGGYEVQSFVEKPNRETAEAFLAGGDHLWNAGMFVLKASVYLRELGTWEPEMLDNCRESVNMAVPDLSFLRVSPEPFVRCKSLSIDHAVMERTELSLVVPLDAGWSDLGSWSSIWKVSPKNEDNNAVVGNAVFVNSRNCLAIAEERLVSLVGVKDISVIETKDAVLVCNNETTEDVKLLATLLQEQEVPEALHHREVYRPWGKFDSVKQGERFKVKQLTVKPGAKLSLQKHYHRAEHWIVVAGTAKITIGEKEFLLTENESTYIPIGETHSLENTGIIDLEIIEVQTGSYLGEDDIVRLEDRYGRINS